MSLRGVQVGDYLSVCALDAGANAYTHEVDAIASAGAPPTPAAVLLPRLQRCHSLTVPWPETVAVGALSPTHRVCDC